MSTWFNYFILCVFETTVLSVSTSEAQPAPASPPVAAEESTMTITLSAADPVSTAASLTIPQSAIDVMALVDSTPTVMLVGAREDVTLPLTSSTDVSEVTETVQVILQPAALPGSTMQVILQPAASSQDDASPASSAVSGVEEKVRSFCAVQ